MKSKTKQYRVRWEIDVEAKDKRDAAKEALKIQRDPESCALYFEVSGDVSILDHSRIAWTIVDLQERPRKRRVQ